ncbi:MAG: GNAT family N-acetyltransferase [Anaerolineales bacterium]|nr:MAG: GNAT family N-acetyltransferase [Anaerolineales bacterium]
MTFIRQYQELDAPAVGLLIKNTYGEFNLSFMPVEERAPFLGPFKFAGSSSPEHLAAIQNIIQSELVFVAEDQRQIVGVLRGRMDRLGSLFVAKSHHRRRIGRQLVEQFEYEILKRNGKIIRIASTLYGIPFYLKLGYKRSTGIRNSWSFDGHGLPIQPMKKVIIP